MKKIIYSLAILALFSQTIVSCDKDDNGTETINPNPNPNPDPNPNPGTQSQIQITASAEQVYLGETITFTATLDGQDVTSTTTFYKDDVAIQGNTLTSNVEGTHLIHASYPNAQNSAYVQVTFSQNPFENIVGTGNFIYNGTTYEINGALLSLQGFYSDGNGGATAWWIQYGWSGNNPDTAQNFVAISYDTPTTLVGEQITDYVMPNENQNTYYSIAGLRTNGQAIVTSQYLEGTGTLNYTSLQAETAPATANFNFQVTSPLHNITFTYNGMVSSPDTGGRPAARTANTTSMKLKSQKQLQEDKLALSNKLLKK